MTRAAGNISVKEDHNRSKVVDFTEAKLILDQREFITLQKFAVQRINQKPLKLNKKTLWWGIDLNKLFGLDLKIYT